MSKKESVVTGDRHMLAMGVLDDPKSLAILRKCGDIDGARLAMFLTVAVATVNCPEGTAVTEASKACYEAAVEGAQSYGVTPEEFDTLVEAAAVCPLKRRGVTGNARPGGCTKVYVL